VSAALAAEGYPLGDATTSASAAKPAIDEATWTPSYRVTRTEVGADVNYACPCSCEAGFALDRAQATQAPESCCCGRQILVGSDAESRLRAAIEGGEASTPHRFDVQSVSMPWGQPLTVVLAIPVEGATHGANTEQAEHAH
jgi:hypothetical protein